MQSGFFFKKKLFSLKVFQSSALTVSLMQSTVAALQPGFFFCNFLLLIVVVKENGRAKARELYFPAILSMLYVVLTFLLFLNLPVKYGAATESYLAVFSI